MVATEKAAVGSWRLRARSASGLGGNEATSAIQFCKSVREAGKPYSMRSSSYAVSLSKGVAAGRTTLMGSIKWKKRSPGARSSLTMASTRLATGLATALGWRNKKMTSGMAARTSGR